MRDDEMWVMKDDEIWVMRDDSWCNDMIDGGSVEVVSKPSSKCFEVWVAT